MITRDHIRTETLFLIFLVLFYIRYFPARWDDMRDPGCQGWGRGHEVDTGVFGIALPTTSIVTKYKGKTKTGGSEIYDMSEEVFLSNIIKS